MIGSSSLLNAVCIRFPVKALASSDSKMSRFAVLFLAVAAVLQHEAIFVQSAEGLRMRWCYIGDEEKTKCMAMKDALKEAAIKAINMTVITECVKGVEVGECLKLIQANHTDLVTLDGGDIMKGEARVVPIVSEQYTETGISYYAVAVVKKTNTGFNLKTLKGKNTCHTGARRSAGWTIPVGHMLSSGLMPVPDTCNRLYKDFMAAAGLFGKSCVPGIPTYDKEGKIPGNLCAICKTNCTSSDDYAGYTGAFRCMADGAGDVAFVKHTTTEEAIGNGNVNDYEYLCTDGTRKAIGKHKECNLGTSPAHAVVARKGDNHTDHHYVLVLLELAKLYGVDQTNASDFQLFNSSKYGSKGNLLFKDSAVGLKEIKTKTIEGYMGDYAKDYKALTSCVTAKPTTVHAKASVTSVEFFMLLSLVAAVLMI